MTAGLLRCAGASGEAQDAKRARLAEGTQPNGRPRSGQPQSPRGGAASAAAGAAAANGHAMDVSKGRPKRQVGTLLLYRGIMLKTGLLADED